MSLTDVVDFPIIDKINAIGGVLMAIVSYIFGEHWVLFVSYMGLNVLDYITGTMKGRLLKKESSNAGLIGILKKFLYWIVIVISFALCPILNELGEAIGTDLSPFSPFIGWFVLCSFIVNELRSVLENLVEMGIHVPLILIKGLQIITTKVQTIEPDMIDENLNKDNTSSPTKQNDSSEEKDSVTLKIHTIDDDQ